MFTDRFEIQKKDYSYSAQVNFAECREKVKIDPNATVCVDFMKEEQEKKAVKTAESPHTVAQSTQQDSAKPTLSPRETSEIALEADDKTVLQGYSPNPPARTAFATTAPWLSRSAPCFADGGLT